jgi:hypothetical protein
MVQTLEQANEFVQYLLKVSGKDKIEGLLLDCVKVTKIDTSTGQIELEVAKAKTDDSRISTSECLWKSPWWDARTTDRLGGIHSDLCKVTIDHVWGFYRYGSLLYPFCDLGGRAHVLIAD